MRHRVGVGLVCTLLFTVSATAGVYSQCRRLCRPEIVRCRAAGFPRATCRRVLRADCIARGAALCPFVLPATTTVPPSPTTTLAPSTTTTLPGLCAPWFVGSWQIAEGRWSTPDGCGSDARLFSPFTVDGGTSGQLFGSISIPGGTVSAPHSSQWSDAFTLDTGAFDGARPSPRRLPTRPRAGRGPRSLRPAGAWRSVLVRPGFSRRSSRSGGPAWRRPSPGCDARSAAPRSRAP